MNVLSYDDKLILDGKNKKVSIKTGGGICLGTTVVLKSKQDR